MSQPAAAHPGPPSVHLSVALVQAIVDHARAEDPNEACGLIIGDRPAADGGVALRFEAGSQPGRVAVPLRDPSRRPAPPDDRDRRCRRGVLGDRPQPRPLAGLPEPDRRRPRVLPGRPVRARVAGRGRAGARRVPDRGRHDLPGRAARRRRPRERGLGAGPPRPVAVRPTTEPTVALGRPASGGDVPDAGRLAWLVVGALAIAAGTALGWDATALVGGGHAAALHPGRADRAGRRRRDRAAARRPEPDRRRSDRGRAGQGRAGRRATSAR